MDGLKVRGGWDMDGLKVRRRVGDHGCRSLYQQPTSFGFS